VSELVWPGMMLAGSAVVVVVVELPSGAETRRVVQTLVIVCHYERRKTRNRAVLRLSLWRLKRAAASRWVRKDVEMRIWRHCSKGQVA